MSAWLIIHRYLIPVLVLVLGIFRYRDMSRFLKILFFQLALYCIVMFMARLVLSQQRSRGETLTTEWLYNLYLPLEMLFLFVAMIYYFKNKNYTLLSVILLSVFLLSFISEGFIDRYLIYCNFSESLASIFIVALGAIALWKEFRGKVSWYRKPELWAFAGLVIYFACQLPYVSLFPYLKTMSGSEEISLLRFINLLLGNIMYLLLGVAFLSIRKKTQNPPLIAHEY